MSGPASSKPPSHAASSADDDPPAASGEPSSGERPLPPSSRDRASAQGTKRTAATLTLGALGVVFGDIGTSPLYALHAVFSAGVTPNEASVYGVISLVFWAITLIVSIKYVTFIMRADNDGEGGIMALISLVQSAALERRFAKWALIALGIFGASLFYGDGMITPAISVLSAVEGLEVAAPDLASFVVPITLVILAALSAFNASVLQRWGVCSVQSWASGSARSPSRAWRRWSSTPAFCEPSRLPTGSRSSSIRAPSLLSRWPRSCSP